ncbi:MAG: helix-turn-helix domain-containing protein, partial [Patescibacteria group bacterium]
MKQSSLISLGFTEKEAKIYLACLELGHGSAVQIAQKASLPRSTAYDALRTLMQKSLLTSFLKGSKKRFAISDPGILQIRLEEQEKRLQSLMPELQALFVSKSTKPRLRFYEGKQGLTLVLKEALEEADEMISVSHIEDIFDKLHEYFPKFSQERAKKKIPIRIISRDSIVARERQKLGRSELREVKIKETPIPFRSVFFAWKNKVAMITLQEDL